MKDIFITGGNEGIGYYIVIQLLNDGNRVGVLDVKVNNLEELKKKYQDNLHYYLADIRNSEAVSKAAEDFAGKAGKIDYAIHNACLCTFEPFEKLNNEDFVRVFEVNFYGGLNMIRAVTPIMEKKGGGDIYVASSGVGVTGFINISPYASSKGALEALVKCLALEYREKGINFHIIHPPLTNTKSSEPLPVPKEFKADPEKVGRGIARRLSKKSFIICHNGATLLQTKMCYRHPLFVGRLMTKMTEKAKTK